MHRSTSIPRLGRQGVAVLLLCLLGGCGSPDKANVQLRRERDEHLAELQSLRDQLAATRSRLESLESQHGTVQTLPQSRLDQLYTAHDITLGRLTGGADLDPARPGDEALKVYFSPVDESGAPSKSTGHVTVEIFNLDRPNDSLLAQWTLTPQQLKNLWVSLGPLHHFVLTFPLQRPPPQSKLLLRVSFRDELTSRSFTKTQEITIQPPAAPPATQASSR